MKRYKRINAWSYKPSFSDPTWYIKLQPLLKEYFWDYKGNSEEKSQDWLKTRDEFVNMVSELLIANEIALGKSGKNWDEDRLPIDTIVIHHTSTTPDDLIITLDALGLLRIYSSVYSNKEEGQFGLPIWSNHFYKGRQTFVSYHYLIREDGSYEQLLKDEYIGWHCGNYMCNRRSIAIAFLDCLDDKSPTQQALEKAKTIIGKYRPRNVLGHKDINRNVTCPGKLFDQGESWRNLLLSK